MEDYYEEVLDQAGLNYEGSPSLPEEVASRMGLKVFGTDARRPSA